MPRQALWEFPHSSGRASLWPCCQQFLRRGRAVEALVSSSAFRRLSLSTRRARDRGCVTPQILGNISSYGVERVAGFSSLQAEDQARVRLAVKRRRIDPADFTGSSSLSQPIPQPSQSTSTQAPAASTGKRRADTAPGPSQSHNVAMPSPTQAAARQAVVGGTAWEEGADAEEVVEEQIDELYCTVSSSVVGIQYYKGACLYCLMFHGPVTMVCMAGLVDAGEQVRLIREPQNKYDRWAIRALS